MSTGYRCRAHVLWITLQLLVFANPDPRAGMALAHFTPYVSEFEYSSRFHPSKNPDCPNSGWADNSGRDFGSRRYRRSPEEGSPVGQEPSIEVRAILVRCPKTSEESDDVPINRNVYNITAGRSQDILDFHGFDRDEPPHHSEVRDCRRKLIVTMKFNNIGRTKTQEEFVVIDHVLDPITMHKARLLNPFVVKVRQEPVLQLYGLKFEGVVNAEAREEVINKKLSNYTGCDDESENPTCGQMIFEGKPIPYSRGFCCSCDSELNVQRQASLLNETVVSSFPSFFSRSRETPIRPFKSPRSVSTDIRDTLTDPDEIGDIGSLDDPERKDLPRSSPEFLENSKIAKIGKNLVPIEYDNTTIDGSHDDEQDLLKLKRTNKLKKENRYRPIWKTIFGEADDETTIAPQIVFSPPGSSRQRSDFSKSVETNFDVSPNPRQRSFDRHRHVDGASESRSTGGGVFSNYRSTTDRYRSSYQNQRSVDLAAELTKLEDDYKNLRLSNIMRSSDRNNEARDKIPGHKSPLKSFVTMIGTDYRQRYFSTSGRKMPSLKDDLHERGPALSINVNLAVRPEQKSTVPQSSSIYLFATSCSERTSLPVTGRPPFSPEVRTPSVLRQKLVSDRVYPSLLPSVHIGERANVSTDFSHQTEFTTDLTQKLDSYLADLLADAVMADDEERPSTEDTGTILDETSRETSFVNSITGSSPPFEGTAKYQHRTEYSGTNIDNPSDRAESPTDSSPIFSSGNISRGNAILASGSLKNQLAKWLPHEEGNSSLVKSAGSKSKERLGSEGEVRYSPLEEDDLTTTLEETDNPADGPARYEDRSTTVVADRRPVQVYLSSDAEYDSSGVRDDEKVDQHFIPRRRKEKALRNTSLGFFDYPDLAPRKRSMVRNARRSYRSIGEDDALFVRDNDRQRSIDKRIDDEFEEISDALKEAADGSKIVREKPKSESTFEQDESVVRKFATIFDKSIEARTELTKHTEPFVEPVSDVMLTTGHRIVVDRFRIVNDFQEIPAAYAKPSPETASTDSLTNPPSRMRDRKQEFPMTSSPKSSTIVNETSTRSVSESLETTNYRIMVDRLDLVDDFNEVLGKKPVQHEKFQSISTELSSTAKPEVAVAIGKDTSDWSAPSPVLTIAKLKKELRKEADRYSSISQTGSALRDLRNHPRMYNEVREVNTELTPAERVEDSITDEETLPPDEETKLTTDALAKTTSFPTTSSVDRSTINEYTFPRLGIESFDARIVNTGHALPLKRANELLVVLEEASPSSSQRPQRRGHKRVYKKRRHRHRDRRYDRHQKRSVKTKRNVRDSTTVRYIVKAGSENEDDEHPWYEATTRSKTTRSKDRNDYATTMPIAKTTQQNRKRRFYIETTTGSRDSGENDRRATDLPIDRKLSSAAGQFYVSITRIPESENRPGAGLRIEEITRVNLEKSNFGSELDEAVMMKSMRWPDNSSEVDEMPIFRDTKNFDPDERSDGREVGDESGETIGRSKRNLQTFSAANSIKDERHVDTAQDGEDVGRGNKRNYQTDYFESEPEAQIFYDYEDSDAESGADKGNEENSRSLVGSVRGEVNPVSDKNYRSVVDENGDESSVKSSGIMRRAPDSRQIVERGGSKSLNHRLNGRSGGERGKERVSKNTDLLHEDIAAKSSASLDGEERGLGHFSGNQFGIEPSDGWKEKMELLKLKKHADVLKEYLNWRQDVAPPESREMPGYTTMISPTNAREEQTSDFFTTVYDRKSDESTSASGALSTGSTVTDGVATAEERTDVTDFKSPSDDRYDANETTIAGSVETSVIVGADNRPLLSEAENRSVIVGAGNRSVILGADDRPVILGGDNRPVILGADNRPAILGADDRSAILGDDNRSVVLGADNRSASCSGASSMTTTVVTQTSTGCPENKTAKSFRQDDGSSTGRILPPCGYQNGGIATCRTDGNAARTSTSRTPVGSTRSHQTHLSDIDRDLIIISVIEKNRLENKTRFYSTKQNGRTKVHRAHDDAGSAPIFQQHRRRHESKNSEISVVRGSKKNRHSRRTGRRLMTLEDSDERNDPEEYDRMFEDVYENRYTDLSILDGDEGVSEEWSQKWNRIIEKIIHENTTEPWKSGNSIDSSLTEVSGDSRSALQQLHVKNADIRQIAKNIVHNTNIHEEKREKDRPATRHEASRRKLQSYSITRRKVVRKADNFDDFENYDAKRSVSRVGSKIDHSCIARGDSPDRRAHAAPRSAEAVASSSKETSEPDKTGRDFAISLSGKIHVEGGTNGQPMSISFDTAPDISTGNESAHAYQNGTSTLENSTKIDGETAPSTNFLSSLFNIASVPKDLPLHPQNETGNSSASAPIRQSVRDVDGEPSRFSRENHGQKFPSMSKKHPKVRKSRAVDDEDPEGFARYREGRSNDLGQSRLFEDIDEDDDVEDYPESSNEVNYSDLSEYDDKPFVSAERRSLNSRGSCPETNEFPAPDHRSLNRPEVKVIKIIPLDAPKSHASLSSSVSNHEETKASRITALQSPKTEDDTVPGTTVKPGKIKPAELARYGSENEDASNAVLDTMDENDFPSKSSGSCSYDGNGDDQEERKESSLDGRIPTSSPVSLRVVGLVGMRQPSGGSTGNANVNSDPNYAIIPLVHVKIQQQSDNREEPRPQPAEERCPGVEVTNPPEELPNDQSPCQKSNEEGVNVQAEDYSRRPEVATISMENDEESREPVEIGSCPESNRKDAETLRDYSNDSTLNRTWQPEVASPFAGNRGNTPKTRPGGALDGSDSRKKIRLKNMLAIMRFMKKIKEIMNGKETPELSDRDDKDIVIKLDRVVVLPNDQSYGTRKKIVEPEETTDRVVMMGEGVRHEPLANGISFEKSFNLSESKGSNEAPSRPKIGSDFNETESGNMSSGANWKTSERYQDKSFLFYGGSDELGAVNRSIVREPIDQENGNPGERPNEEGDSEKTHNIRLIERLQNAQNVVNPDGDSSNVSTVPNDSQSNDPAAVRVFVKKFDDRLRSVKNREPDEGGRSNGVDDFSLMPKTKRHRSAACLRPDRTRYDLRKERDAKSQIYGRRSLPTGREVSHFGGRKFGRHAAAKGGSKEKRARKKKKKKRRRKKKKKRKRKKGKSHGEAAVKGKAWWPFGRQLMSVSDGREIVLGSNLRGSQVERVRTKRHRDRRVSLPLTARGRRRVHRAKYPHEKKKKRRKHKNGKRRKKKKKKTKGRKGEKKSGSRSKRQIRPGGTQVRGGQDCMDRRHPPDVNPAKYLESAHCLRFSDMWYSVYELESPITEHTVYLQLFEKHSLEDGTTHWDDLTQGTMVRMGTFTRHQKDSKPTIVFTYSGAKTESQKRALNLDPAKQRLLVPSPIPPKKASQYREVRSGLGEYLIVQADAISKDGNDCDKAGVGFAAFSKQEDRCGRAKGSCLRNQPLAYWRHDTEARDSGRPGCYFLSNFASVPTNPIKYNVSGSGSREYLGLEYHSAHVSAIDIEVRTDYNAIIRVGSSGRVTEVYVDSTALEHTVVTVVISNMGLTSSPYQPRITDCPTGLPVSWTKAKGIMQVIPPQHDQRVTLDLYGQLSMNGFHCSVEVVNHRGELVAMRRIRVQKMDRCFCVWHCLCACIGSVSGMGCQPMSPEHYHAAGFQGPVPVVTTETSVLMNAVKDVLMLSALLVLLLLLLGILKWFVGKFVPAVGRWGLDSLLEGSRIEKYLEPELECRCVVTDDDGAPVHPDTGQRTVRICSRKLEFGLNLIFFLTYPIAICCGYFRRSLNASRQRNCCPDESKMCLINEKGSCPKMICVSTYGDSRNSKLEAEDTRYVMNELKKSQESLENPKRTKKRDGYMNGSSKNLTKKSSHKNKSASDVSAKRFVDDLLKRRTVFRNLTEPIGGLLVPAGTTYSIRGYFLNAEDGGYRFITPCPFKQHWLIVNNQKKASKPPEIYPSSHFMRSFGTARDVYESNELSLIPEGICVNVQYLENS